MENSGQGFENDLDRLYGEQEQDDETEADGGVEKEEEGEGPCSGSES
jgi:hypothetical protein